MTFQLEYLHDASSQIIRTPLRRYFQIRSVTVLFLDAVQSYRVGQSSENAKPSVILDYYARMKSEDDGRQRE